MHPLQIRATSVWHVILVLAIQALQVLLTHCIQYSRQEVLAWWYLK